jgi:hypothetical protein
MSGGMLAVMPTRRTSPVSGTAVDGGGACDCGVWHPKIQALRNKTAPTKGADPKRRQYAISIPPLEFRLFNTPPIIPDITPKVKRRSIDLRAISPSLA